MAAQLDPELIKEIRDGLVAALSPVGIWLFGSHAKGTANNESDVDLLVIMPEGTKPVRSMTTTARRAIAEALYSRGFAFDLLISSSESFNKFRGYPGTIQHEVVTHGVSILDR